MEKRKFITGCTLVFVLFLNTTLLACGDDKDKTILVIETNGGCMMAGPNCPRYELRKDGSYDVYRLTEPEVAATAQLDSELVEKWITLVKSTDFEKMKARLGEGTCNACIDGTDFTYEVSTKTKSIILDSQKEDFHNNNEPFFEMTKQLFDEMRINTPLEMKFRHKR